jgi:hypothetical protein
MLRVCVSSRVGGKLGFLPMRDTAFNPFPGLLCCSTVGIFDHTTWPVALKKDTVPPKYDWCMLTVCGLGQFLAQKKWESFKRYGTTAAPLEPDDLVWTDTDTGGTKVRDYPKAVGSCASATMVGISYRDIHDLFLMLRDVIPMLLPHPNRTHLAGGGCFSTSSLRYVTGRPSGSVKMTRMDLLECGIFLSI